MFNNIINRIGVALLLVLLPFSVQAAWNDVTMEADTVITTGGVTLYVTGSTASISSIEVGASNFIVTLMGTSSVSVKSTDRYVINSTAAGRYVLTDCTGSAYTLTLTVPKGESGEQAVTITPTTDVCSSSTGTSGSRSGGGGGGSSYVAPKLVVTQPTVPVTVPVTTNPVASALRIGDTGTSVIEIQSFLESKGFLKMPLGVAKGYFGPLTQKALEAYKMSSSPTSAQAPASTGSSSFSRALGKGASGEDVRRLQKVLNSDAETRVASEGVGSVGNETTLFGALTEQAASKFQVKYGIASPGDPGYGFVGPKTRAKLNELSK